MMKKAIYFFRHFLILICASSTATIISVLVFSVFIIHALNIRDFFSMIPVFLLWAHVLTFPFLILIYLPLSIALWCKGSNFHLFPAIASLLALINGIIFVMIIGLNLNGMWPFIPLFAGAGFLTGVFHYLFLRALIGKKPEEIISHE